MHSLITRLRPRPVTSSKLATHSPTSAAKQAPKLTQRQPKATYYFDASRHSALSLRLLLNELKAQKAPADLRSTQGFLRLAMDNLLQSIRPGIDDDAESRQYFLALLRMHLSPLSADELHHLSDSLRAAGFGCNVVETIIDDVMYRDHGFANGPPHSFHRTLIQTSDFFDLLQDLEKRVQQLQSQPLQCQLATAARTALPVCAVHWQQSCKTPQDLFHSVRLLGRALDLPVELSAIGTGSLLTKASTVSIAQRVLMIDSAMAEALTLDPQGTLFAEVLRDVLELLLTQKLFGIAAPPDQLMQRQRQDLSAALEKIYSHQLPSGDSALKAKARAVLQEAQRFGQIQIQPTAGVALGHAWIIPSLSLVPDKHKNAVDIGHRYMHSGYHLAPGDALIREWPAHFMTRQESEEAYPAEHAWQVRVPVESGRLQMAAQDVRREWESLNLPYRFTGTAPGMQPTGCRVTVWEAIRRGMDADARALFDHYNCGLPDPQSPTELWQRLDGLMRWMTALAAD